MNDVATLGAAESPEPLLSLSEARQQLLGLLAGEDDLIANAANTAAFLNTLLSDINWLGFYFLKDDVLVLGPFQGNPACVRIPVGRGVCGTCVATGVIQRVDDVHAFPGHIACDIRSRSELVVPIQAQGRIVGVLDIDSPSVARFRQEDQDFVEALADVFTRHQFGQG
ncbi:GAF domain-containing protein [Congregibacter litoralis]|uniref:GAF domain protein-containing protein n=1 Tax=Congregibacter litoralis KT71 TaxID=314285 RepID=A4A6L9_9GAMM|nr:GAF domain-containing protein [Congregibacter litoralis]EAQ98666.1 GAF domain protein-containing protein [Congregibacter litoralis KT71]